MNVGLIIGIVVAIVVVIIVIGVICWWISTSNEFKKMKVKIDESASGIDIALTKRFDKLTKQLNVVKGYAKYEKEAFVEVTAMRTGTTTNSSADDIKRMAEANAQMDQLAKQINLQVEKYPELKANSIFSQLQADITEAEEHLQASRRLFNSNVSRYNQSIIVFPGSIVANAMHLTKADFFQAEDQKRSDVEMNF